MSLWNYSLNVCSHVSHPFVGSKKSPKVIPFARKVGYRGTKSNNFDKSYQNISPMISPNRLFSFNLINVQQSKTLCKVLSLNQLFISPPSHFFSVGVKTNLSCKHLHVESRERKWSEISHISISLFTFDFLFFSFCSWPLTIFLLIN